MSVSGHLFRQIPSIDQLIRSDAFQSLLARYPRHLILQETQRFLDHLRSEISAGDLVEEQLQQRLDRLAESVERSLEERLRPSLRRVINATGVLIHTNVGRAPLSSAVAAAMSRLGSGYSNLEYDLRNKKRGHRDLHFERRVTRLLGCEAATVCNNNAAAVFLILNTLAAGRKVLVSRGELIEIGGSFRLPAIMERSQAILEEVGTTNKTKISDYREAIDEQSALILRVHPSNYRITGFTQKPKLSELVALAREKEIPLVKDAGSGHLFETDHPSLRNEPCVVTALKAGADLVCFSGDKLLGGPQAGIIVGRQALVDKIRKNPLMRVVRVDKVTYSALEHTLIEYEKGTYPCTLPIQLMLSTDAGHLEQRCRNLMHRLSKGSLEIQLREGHSVVGGGSAPEERLPTPVIAISSGRYSPNQIERHLRTYETPILTRIEDDRLIIDLRTVFPEEESAIVEALEEL